VEELLVKDEAWKAWKESAREHNEKKRVNTANGPNIILFGRAF
jgi:hypothetical protein